jgi:hypothetical protein
MSDLPLDKIAPEDDARAGTQLERTHGRAMVALAFNLTWDSERTSHAERVVACKFNLWRDILPPPLEAGLMGQPVGHYATHRFAAGELLETYRPHDCFRIAEKAFNRHLRKCYIEPRAGRFYPRVFIAGTRGIYPQNVQPFRVAGLEGDGLEVDLNHPLADRELDLEARILDIWEGREEHGGACQDVAEIVAANGPGMQARWRNRPTDFWSDIPFARADPGPDADFYAKPRLVHHLDSTARGQIEELYDRLLPAGGRVLDLMSSWTSHLPERLHLSHVSGLGMNAEELAANPRLNDRHVQDLNLDPVLPYGDATFDAAVCTASVEYLTRPQAVFEQVRRVLKPGGRFVITFSNRWFPPKAIKVWEDIHEFERLGLVLEYFLGDGGYGDLHTWSLRGLPRPADDKYAGRLSQADPVYAVWGISK